jgi:hypothetical protein
VVTAVLAVALIISVILNFRYEKQIQQDNQYASLLFNESVDNVFQAAVSLGYRNVQLNYNQASSDIAAAASELQALAQYQSTVQGQTVAPGQMSPPKISRDANYLSYIANALVNQSAEYLTLDGRKFSVTRQAGRRFVLKINSLLVKDVNISNATPHQMRVDVNRLYSAIPSVVKTQLSLELLTFWNLNG